METTLEQKSDAQVFMVKAYVTYVASETTLEGYENGNQSWLEEFNETVKSHQEQQ